MMDNRKINEHYAEIGKYYPHLQRARIAIC